jgi:hypothetical protein
MAGLVPAIHVFAEREKKDVDARHKAEHDDCNYLLLIDRPNQILDLLRMRAELGSELVEIGIGDLLKA